MNKQSKTNKQVWSPMSLIFHLNISVCLLLFSNPRMYSLYFSREPLREREREREGVRMSLEESVFTDAEHWHTQSFHTLQQHISEVLHYTHCYYKHSLYISQTCKIHNTTIGSHSVYKCEFELNWQPHT